MKRINKKPYVRNKVYKTTPRRMGRGEYKILWTAIWLLFIFALCLAFNTMGPLWLLIFWFMGVV